MEDNKDAYIEKKSGTEFYIEESRFGLFTTFYLDGTPILSGATKEGTLSATSWHVFNDKFGWSESESFYVPTDYRL